MTMLWKNKVGQVLAAGVLVTGTGAASMLRPETVAGWTRYVQATEQRRATERGRADKFLALDFQSTAAVDRRALLDGRVVVRRLDAPSPSMRAMEIDGGLVHHWRGAVFIPGATVAGVIAGLEQAPPPQDDVLEARVLERAPDRMRVFLRLRRTKIVTAVYNTEHLVRFDRVDARRSASMSTATKIAEVEAPGTARERERPPGDDRGYLWRLNSYWRYEQHDRGVIAECESLSLSRGVPFGLGYLIGSIVEGTARESMERTLIALRTAFAASGSRTPPSSSPAR